jgi:hypothetical protein
MGRELFLDQKDQWISHSDEARDFGSSTEAIKHITRSGLAEVELFYIYQDGSGNFAVPITSPAEERTSKIPGF